MTDLVQNSAFAQAVALLTGYGFDLKGHHAEELVNKWLKKYKVIWVRLAVIEALYQGRYKAVSVEQILSFWLRRGDPRFHYNREFERLICSKLPRYLTNVSESSSEDQETISNIFSLNNASTMPNQFFRENKDPSSLSATEPEKLLLAISIARKQRELAIDNSQQPQQPSLKVKPENKAKEKLEPPVPYQANWLRCASYQGPIHQFTPIADASEFYHKLKAVAQQSLASVIDVSPETPHA